MVYLFFLLIVVYVGILFWWVDDKVKQYRGNHD